MLRLSALLVSSYSSMMCDTGNIDERRILSYLALVRNELGKADDLGTSAERIRHTLAIQLAFLSGQAELSQRTVGLITAFISDNKLQVPAVLDVDLPLGVTLRCEMNEYVQMMMWLKGEYEPELMSLAISLLSPGMCVFDIGSNIGQYTTVFGKAYDQSCQVHSFEPVSDNYRKLLANVQKNALVNVHAACHALADRQTNYTMVLPQEFAGVFPNYGAYQVANLSGYDRIQPTTMTLDIYCSQNSIDRVDFIKLDVEGSETRVLRGAYNLLSKCDPLILMEVNADALHSCESSVTDLDNLIDELKFSIFQVGKSRSRSGPIRSIANMQFGNVLLYRGALPL